MSTQKEATRRRLLDAAGKLLVKRGFHGVSLEDIAETAGVSRQAVYKSHFASKAELVLALVDHVHVSENLDEQLTRPFFEAKSALEMLEEAIRAIVRIEVRVHELALVLSAAAATDAGAAAAWHTRLEVKQGAFRAALERLQNEGRLNPSWQLERAVDIVAALVSVETYQQLVVERGWTPDELIQRVWELSRATLVVEPKALAPPRKRAQKAG